MNTLKAVRQVENSIPGTRSHGTILLEPHRWFEQHLAELQSRLGALFSRLDQDAREEAVQDCLCCIWAWTVNAARRGTLDRHTPYNAVVFASKGYRCGRRFAGSSRTDALAEGTLAAGRVVVTRIDNGQDEKGGNSPLSNVLADRRGWDNPVENVRRDHDYPKILAAEEVTEKARTTFRLLAESHGDAGPTEIGIKLGVTPGRVCQLKDILADTLERHDYRPACKHNSRRRGRPQVKKAVSRRLRDSTVKSAA